MGTSDSKASGSDKGERVHETIEKTLSPEPGEASSSASEREPAAKGNASPEVQAAAQNRLAEIQERVGELVEDPEIKQDAVQRKS